jgi:uncharacterized SAM-dependent methyltransferase
MVVAESTAILDITSRSLVNEVVGCLLKVNDDGHRSIPDRFLWDDAGLSLFDKIASTKDYYLTKAEMDILDKDAQHIASMIPDNATVIELGCG